MSARVSIPVEDLRVGDLMYVAGHGHRALELLPYSGPEFLLDLATAGWRTAVCEDDWRITITPGDWVEVAARP